MLIHFTPCQKLFMIVSLVTGRAPNTKRLNLEAVGVQLDDKNGAIKVSSYLLNVLVVFPHVTSFPRILEYENSWNHLHVAGIINSRRI